jgi:hypothetical protein
MVQISQGAPARGVLSTSTRLCGSTEADLARPLSRRGSGRSRNRAAISAASFNGSTTSGPCRSPLTISRRAIGIAWQGVHGLSPRPMNQSVCPRRRTTIARTTATNAAALSASNSAARVSSAAKKYAIVRFAHRSTAASMGSSFRSFGIPSDLPTATVAPSPWPLSVDFKLAQMDSTASISPQAEASRSRPACSLSPATAPPNLGLE